MPRGRPRKSIADPIEKDDSKWNKEDDRIKNKDIRFRKKILEDQKCSFTELADFLTSLYNNASQTYRGM